jgi:hypothetical protein
MDTTLGKAGKHASTNNAVFDSHQDVFHFLITAVGLVLSREFPGRSTISLPNNRNVVVLAVSLGGTQRTQPSAPVNLSSTCEMQKSRQF